MGSESELAYCKICERESRFIRTERGFWLCTNCLFSASYINGDEVKGGEKENE